MAKTKKGRRCKKLVPASQKDSLCFIHKKKKRSGKWRKLATGFAKTTLVLTTTQTIIEDVGRVGAIYHFLVDHWPAIEHWFHGTIYSTYLRHWRLWVVDAEAIVKSGADKAARKLLVEFRGDFAELPAQVQGIIEAHFGKETIEKLTRSVAH